MSGPLLAIVGPTATGKTPLAVAVALRRGGEILNADSRQVIRGLRVGTCAPTETELRGVPCHLLDLREPGEPFTVADWLVAARAALADVRRRGSLPILVGGTGLYVSALLDGLDMEAPPPDPDERRRRTEQATTAAGLAILVEELRRRDPDAAALVDLRNPRRVVRALEILEVRPRGLTARDRPGGEAAVVVGLDAPRELHEQWVRSRAAGMLETGALQAEVESALARGVGRAALEAAGIGYREALAVVDGTATVAGALDEVVVRTRRYAKAQRTFFRRDRRTRWLERHAGPVEALVGEVDDALHEDAGAGQRLPGR